MRSARHVGKVVTTRSAHTTSPARNAVSAASTRLRVPSSVNTAETCVLTVVSLRNKRPAMSASDAPVASTFRTSRSRSDSLVSFVTAGDEVVAYTVGPLQAVDSLLRSYLCSEVMIVNVGTAENDFNGYTDWHVQDAGGAIRDSTFGTDRPMLESGRLAPGGTATGNVCFDARSGAAPGTCIVLYEDTFSLSTDRLAWVSTL